MGPGNPITEDGLVRFFEHLRTGEGLKPYPLMAYIRAISAMGKRQERIVLIYKMPGVADFIKRHIPKANLFFPNTHSTYYSIFILGGFVSQTTKLSNPRGGGVHYIRCNFRGGEGVILLHK